MNKPIAKARLQRFYVLLQDTAACWRNLQVEVRAYSRAEAGRVALLSRREKDGIAWEVEIVVEAEAA